MIFRPELAAKVMDGSKTVTRRLATQNPRSPWWIERTWYMPGKVFTINPGRGAPNIGCARVTAADRYLWSGELSDVEARREGFATSAEFLEAFGGINGSVAAGRMLWRVEFERV